MGPASAICCPRFSHTVIVVLHTRIAMLTDRAHILCVHQRVEHVHSPAIATWCLAQMGFTAMLLRSPTALPATMLLSAQTLFPVLSRRSEEHTSELQSPC